MNTDDIWNDFFGDGFTKMNKIVEKVFSNIDEPGTRTYGYTMYQGPDGIPHVKEFGNTIGEKAAIGDHAMEPLTDVAVEDSKVRAVAEIPGVSKEDIVLESTRNSLSITVDTPKRKFSKILALPCDVDPDSASAEYNNGILEVILDRIGSESEKKRISIR